MLHVTQLGSIRAGPLGPASHAHPFTWPGGAGTQRWPRPSQLGAGQVPVPDSSQAHLGHLTHSGSECHGGAHWGCVLDTGRPARDMRFGLCVPEGCVLPRPSTCLFRGRRGKMRSLCKQEPPPWSRRPGTEPPLLPEASAPEAAGHSRGSRCARCRQAVSGVSLWIWGFCNVEYSKVGPHSKRAPHICSLGV